LKQQEEKRGSERACGAVPAAVSGKRAWLSVRAGFLGSALSAGRSIIIAGKHLAHITSAAHDDWAPIVDTVGSNVKDPLHAAVEHPCSTQGLFRFV
jgi:hypothetical protein